MGCGDSTSVRTLENREKIVEFKAYSQKEILATINEARAITRDCQDQMGMVGPVEPLTWSNILSKSAFEHSRDMVLTDTFSHNGSGTKYDITGTLYGKKSLFSERIEENGYSSYGATGENIAVGIYNLDELMNRWLESPTHCANIMNDNFTNVAVEVMLEEESVHGIYWTQDFSAEN